MPWPHHHFESEEEFQEDRLASLIPRTLWENLNLFYQEGLPDNLRSLMAADLPSLVPAIKEYASSNRLDENDRINAWIAVVFSHQGLDLLTLRQIATELGMIPTELLQAAAAAGHRDIFIELLGACANNEERLKMLEDNNQRAFNLLVETDRRELLAYLETIMPQEVLALIEANNWAALRFAAQYGHDQMMAEIIRLSPGNLIKMLEARDETDDASDDDSDQDSVDSDDSEDSDDLDDLDDLDDIRPPAYSIFKLAAWDGKTNVLEFLRTAMPGVFNDMVRVYGADAFRRVVEYGFPDTAYFLLSYSEIFAYADLYSQDLPQFNQYIMSFIDEFLRNLQRRRPELGNLPNNEAKLAYYVVQRLLAYGDEGLPHIEFLLEIPAVRALAATAVDENPANELYRVASRINQGAARILLRIPEVAQLQSGARGDLELREIARNPESAMRALDTRERKQLERVSAHYNPKIAAAGGVENVVQNLRATLADKYNKTPATIIRDDETTLLKLPLDWQDVAQLDLTPEEETRARQAYYTHQVHTAFRYLLLNNPLLSRKAVFVEQQVEGTDRRSTFASASAEIAAFFLAAGDPEWRPLNGNTLETRLDLFIGGLAQAGRAHNWDKTRVKTIKPRQFLKDERLNSKINTDAKGRPSLDPNGFFLDANKDIILADDGNPIKVTKEAYDDLKPDQPTCPSGAIRRFFQPLQQSHGLFRGVTEDSLRTEIETFVRQHFQQMISVGKKLELTGAWESIVFMTGDATTALKTLDSLNVPVEAQLAFIETVAQQYEKEYEEPLDEESKLYLLEQFKIEQDQPSRRNHAERFGAILSELLPIQDMSSSADAAVACDLGPSSHRSKRQHPEMGDQNPRAGKHPHRRSGDDVSHHAGARQRFWSPGRRPGGEDGDAMDQDDQDESASVMRQGTS